MSHCAFSRHIGICRRLLYLLTTSVHFLLQIQRNLQLRIEEQGRYLQMMFEKQRMAGVDMLQASSSNAENPTTQLTEATQSPLATSEQGTEQMKHGVRPNDPDDKAITAPEGCLRETQEVPEVATSEDLVANVTTHSDSQPAKRMKLNE